MDIKCENPKILFHPYLTWFVCTRECTAVVGNGHKIHYLDDPYRYYNFPWRDFCPLKNIVTIDNYKDFYIEDDKTGDQLPIFILAPCNHCKLCREKKADEWQVRCLAESNAWPYPPLFVNLTYNNEHQPEFGVSKDDIQKFLKRLRRRIEYHLGVKTSLRYFICAEYGKKTHRPHYHMLLWNMPFIEASPGHANSFQTLQKFIEDAWQNGFTPTSVCRDQSGKYCMKYMRKGSIIPIHHYEVVTEDGKIIKKPVYKNDTFFLSSRGSEFKGIGYPFLSQHFDDYKRFVDLMSISLKTFDKSGVVKYKEYPIPTYFKNKLWPTCSQLFPQRVSNAVRTFLETSTRLYAFYECNPTMEVDLSSIIKELLSRSFEAKEKYGDLFRLYFDIRHCSGRFYRKLQDYACTLDDIGDGDVIDDVFYDDEETYNKYIGKSLDFSIDLYSDIINNYDSWKVIKDFTFDHSKYLKVLNDTYAHKAVVKELCKDKPGYNIESLVHKFDVDRRWEETHWLEDAV